MSRSSAERWRAWLKGVRGRPDKPVEVVLIEPSEDGTPTTTPLTLEELDEAAPPGPGARIEAHFASRPQPFTFHGSLSSAAPAATPAGRELTALLRASQQGHERYSELVQPTLEMYRDENIRLMGRVRELEADLERERDARARERSSTLEERVKMLELENRKATRAQLVDTLRGVAGKVKEQLSIAPVMDDLRVVLEKLPPDLREQILATDPERSARLIDALIASQGGAA